MSNRHSTGRRDESNDDEVLDSIFVRRRRLRARNQRRFIIGIVCGGVCIGCLLLTILGIFVFYRSKDPITPALSNEPSTKIMHNEGRQTVMSGTITRFYIGDDALEFLKGALGEKSNLKPALQIRTLEYGEVDCLFAENQEEQMIRIFAGDSITIEGELQDYGSGVLMMRNCRLISPRR